MIKPSFCIQPGAGMQAAMGRLRMGSAVKVLLGFSHPGVACCSTTQRLPCAHLEWLRAMQACTSVNDQLLGSLLTIRTAH